MFGRVADLVAVRYARMAENSLTFLRGSALLQAQDLVRAPDSGIEVRLCGDAHLNNFGIFASPERRLVFDVNDFDETSTGPFEWDLKRLATSMHLAAGALGLARQRRRTLAIQVAESYRASMRAFAELSAIDVWYSHLDVGEVPKDLRSFFRSVTTNEIEKAVARAKPGHRPAHSRLLVRLDGAPALRSAPPLQVPLAELDEHHEHRDVRQILDRIVHEYSSTLRADGQELLSQYEPVDAARKVVGVGSIGTRCYVILLLGRDADDTFVLQVKEAGASVLDQARSRTSPVAPGVRVVEGQRLMQAVTDELLGAHQLDWPDGKRRSFYVRQYFDHQSAVDPTALRPSLLLAYGRLCAWTLARAHARGGRSAEITGYLGSSDVFDRAIGDFAEAAARRTRDDHRALLAAIVERRVTAGP
jgi:hypothetical protein